MFLAKCAEQAKLDDMMLERVKRVRGFGVQSADGGVALPTLVLTT